MSVLPSYRPTALPPYHPTKGARFNLPICTHLDEIVHTSYMFTPEVSPFTPEVTLFWPVHTKMCNFLV